MNTSLTIIESQDVPSLLWDRPNYFFGKDVFIPAIFDGNLGEPIPDGFNAVKISLNGRITSDLNWTASRILAGEYASQGFKLFWAMDLGLFSDLTQPLGNQGQYASLGLALDHFRDTLWKEFQNVTLGLCLYRGSADFSQKFPWDEQQHVSLQKWLEHRFKTPQDFSRETFISIDSFSQIDDIILKSNESGKHLLSLFCRDAAVEYLDILVANLPDALQPYLLLDASNIENPHEFAQLITKERFERWHCAVKGGPLPFQDLAWQEGSSSYGYISDSSLQISKSEQVNLGVCLPSADLVLPSHYIGFEDVMAKLRQRRLSFRIIPETFLITDWDGLDHIIVLSKGVSSQGKRKLQGFCAAGGTVVTVGPLLGLPLEISAVDFLV